MALFVKVGLIVAVPDEQAFIWDVHIKHCGCSDAIFNDKILGVAIGVNNHEGVGSTLPRSDCIVLARVGQDLGINPTQRHLCPGCHHWRVELRMEVKNDEGIETRMGM